MKHNYLSLLLALLMSMVASVASAYDFYKDGIFYNITSTTDLTVEVTYRGSISTEYPNRYMGSVTIPGTVTYNEKNYDVTRIGDDAFIGCRNLTSITIPESVTCIGNSAFQACSGLTSVTLPNGVTSIGNLAFNGCTGLTYINLPEGLATIGESAFLACIGLTSIIIPSSVTTIGNSAFSGCSGLTSVTINSNHILSDSYSSVNNIGSIFGEQVTSYVIGEGVTSIGSHAFQDCQNMTSLTILEGVTSIGSYAFDRCSGLTSVTIPDGVTSIGELAFYGCSGLTTIVIPEGVTSIGQNAFQNCGIQSIKIPQSLTSIAGGLFADCENLTSITIPEGVTSIGMSAFTECNNLISVIIPASVTSIGLYAFYNCNNLRSVTILSSSPVAISRLDFTQRYFATLYVPYGCKAAYELANYWKEFYSIVELVSNITVGSTGMATYCSPYDLDFTDSDAKAYIVSGFTPSTAQVILTRVYDVKAGTGIVVKAAAGSYEIPVKAAETIVPNMLVGVTESTVLSKVEGDYTNYILAKKDDVLGFYAVADGSTLGANKAYLPLLTSALPAAEVKMMLVFDDEELATGIEAPEKQEASEGAIYNLNGQRMSRLHKGVNIVGGKKVFIK